MQYLVRPLDWVVHNLAYYVGAALLLTLVAVTNVDVGLRKSFEIFRNPLFDGANDFSRLCLLLIVAIALGYGARTGGNVSVEILNSFLPQAILRWIHTVIRLFSAGLLGFGAYLMYHAGVSSLRYKYATAELNIPLEIFYYIFAVGIAIYALVMLLEAVNLIITGKFDLLVDESAEVSADHGEDASRAGSP